MHQYACIGDIIGMVILDLEVIDLNGAFQNLVLDLLDYNIFTVDQYLNITGAELTGIGPAFDGRIERVWRRADDFLAVHKHLVVYIIQHFYCVVNVANDICNAFESFGDFSYTSDKGNKIKYIAN